VAYTFYRGAEGPKGVVRCRGQTRGAGQRGEMIRVDVDPKVQDIAILSDQHPLISGARVLPQHGLHRVAVHQVVANIGCVCPVDGLELVLDQAQHSTHLAVGSSHRDHPQPSQAGPDP